MIYENLPPDTAEIHFARLEEIGSHILPFAAEEGRLLDYARQPLTLEEITDIPPDQLAVAAISRMGEYAILPRPQLFDRVFRCVRPPAGYSSSFWKAIEADSRVELKRYRSNNPLHTSVTVCTSSESQAVLEDLRLLKVDIARLMVDRYKTARVLVSKFEEDATREAEQRGLPWDARAKETFKQLYYTGLGYRLKKPPSSKPSPVVRPSPIPPQPRIEAKPLGRRQQLVPVAEKLPTKTAETTAVTEQTPPYLNYQKAQDSLRKYTDVELRDTDWRTYHSGKSKRTTEPEAKAFSTVGEALDHYVSLFASNISIHTAASFVRYLCPEQGASVGRDAFNALMVLVDKDERFTKLGVNTLNQSIYRLEAPGAQDTFQIDDLQTLAPHAIEAALALEITEPIRYMDFLYKVLAKLQVPLPRSDSQMVRLALIVQTDRRVVTTLSDQSGIKMHVLPVRHRQRTRGGKEVNEPVEDDANAAVFGTLVEELARNLDPNMLTVTREYLLSHIKKLRPDISPAEAVQALSFVARHRSFTSRDEQNNSFAFTAPNVSTHAFGNKPTAIAVSSSFDALGIIRPTSHRK